VADGAQAGVSRRADHVNAKDVRVTALDTENRRTRDPPTHKTSTVLIVVTTTCNEWWELKALLSRFGAHIECQISDNLGLSPGDKGQAIFALCDGSPVEHWAAQIGPTVGDSSEVVLTLTRQGRRQPSQHDTDGSQEPFQRHWLSVDVYRAAGICAEKTTLGPTHKSAAGWRADERHSDLPDDTGGRKTAAPSFWGALAACVFGGLALGAALFGERGESAPLVEAVATAVDEEVAPPGAVETVAKPRQASLTAWASGKTAAQGGHSVGVKDDDKKEVINLTERAEVDSRDDKTDICRITVRTQPAGVLVRWDGRELGRTPLVSVGVACGSAEVELRRARWLPTTRTVIAEPGNELTITHTMQRPRGELALVSVPKGASIEVNGQNRGETPRLIDVERFQNLRISLRKEGFEAWHQLRIVRNKAATIVARLDRSGRAGQSSRRRESAGASLGRSKQVLDTTAAGINDKAKP